MKGLKLARAFFLLLACLQIPGCGYHLVGTGRGIVPADVEVVRVVGAGETTPGFLRAWQGFVRDHTSEYIVISAENEQQADAEMRITDLRESLVPITFDAVGIATVDRMTLAGELSLWRDDERIWESGAVSAYEDVDVSGGPTAIESAKARIRSDLETGWMRQAWLKLSSGF